MLGVVMAVVKHPSLMVEMLVVLLVLMSHPSLQRLVLMLRQALVVLLMHPPPAMVEVLLLLVMVSHPPLLVAETVAVEVVEAVVKVELRAVGEGQRGPPLLVQTLHQQQALPLPVLPPSLALRLAMLVLMHPPWVEALLLLVL